MPNIFSGYQQVDDPGVRAKFEADWGVTLPTTTGLDNHGMIEAIHKGTLKSLYLKGEDTITSAANANYVGEALSKLEFLILQDSKFSQPAPYADRVVRTNRVPLVLRGAPRHSRPPPQQRRPARALRAGQRDLPVTRQQGDHAAPLPRGLARTRRRARPHHRPPRPTQRALRRRARAGP